MPGGSQEGRSSGPYLECPVCFMRLVPEHGTVLSSGIYSGKCKTCNQDVKFWSVPSPVSEINFTVNGTQYTVQNPDPAMSFNEWLRGQPGLHGTKVMCCEAGCGCCIVSVTRRDLSTSKDVTLAVNSCLFPLCAANGTAVTTIEGLGNRYDGFHPIQEKLAEHNGSQCGYCSPGFVMNMYSLLQENSAPTEQQIEDSFDGNICRCTGYRPILDAMKTFAASSSPMDIEEVTKCRSACRTGVCPVKCVRPPGDQSGDVTWYCPMLLSDLYTLMVKHSKEKVRLVAGNTGKGIFKNDGPFDVMIDISQIKELHVIQSLSEDPNADMVIGAGVSLNQFIAMLDGKASLSSGYKALADHVQKVANVPVRNVGSIAGNLMLTHDHPDFPSDIFTILEAVGARFIIGDSTSASSSQHSLMEFLNLDMTSKVILAILLPVFSSDCVIRTYKIMPRAQNAHAYVNAGFAATIDKSTMTVTAIRMVYGGIGPYAMHATQTETLLTGKKLTDSTTLQDALTALGKDLVLDSPPASASTAYRKSLALGLFYKFYLSALGDKASARVKSAAEPFIRPVSSGTQSYDSQPKEYPLTKPMTKLAAKLQTSGEAQYVSDIPTQAGELHAAFVISTQGNCTLDSMDATEALKMSGVVKFITASDIPKGGANNFMPWSSFFAPEEIFSSGKVVYAGQALGLIVADSQRCAEEAAKAVKVTYKEQKPPILTIDEAIAAKSFFDAQVPTITKGDADTAIKSSPHKVQGQISMGKQYHFHMETQIALCIPVEDGMTVHCATQWIDAAQAAVAQTLNIPVQSVNMSVKRCGGAYGARLTRANHIATACAVAAFITKRPVRLWLNLNTNMEMVGLKEPYKASYTVGVSNDGKLNGIDLNMYCDCGSSVNDVDLADAEGWADNAYFCGNWKIVPFAVKTDTAGNTWCRAPASTQAVFIMETMMEHIGKALGKTPEEVRKANLYQKGQKTQMGQTLDYCSISSLWDDLLVSSEFQKRKTAIDSFNKNNRWRKRGISVVPLKYGVNWYSTAFTAMVSIFHTDGTVAITHGGVEVGQGINTKVAQVAAYSLKCPLDVIAIKPTSALQNPNSGSTGGSITSELCCRAVMGCCDILNKVIDPVRKGMPPSSTWADVISKCYGDGVDLSAKYMHLPPVGNPYNYNSYGVTCTEAELDVLTGERQIIRTDILFDCGESMNPEVDVGQVEGAFVMGLGLYLTEKMIYDPQTGRNLTHGTWEYKPPCSKDIPIDFRISLLKNAPNPLGILRSKAVGEPPLNMACACLFAVKHAVQSARAEISKDNTYFPLDAPAMVEDSQMACLVDPSQFTL